ncbi:MAG: hypothetical protein ACP5FH_04230 [Terracidiphilus sp.]
MTRNLLKYLLILLCFAFTTCTAAHALLFRHSPEVDPGMAVSAFTLLAGALAVARIRRKN